jgi:hypothetical protein
MPVSKIKPEFQIAFQNAGQPWLPDFIGALKSVGDLSSMGAVDSAKVKAAVATNGTWNAFRNSIMGPQNQRSAELGGYFDAIEVYAKTKMVKGGLTPTKAVDAAIEQILTSTMAPVEVTRPALNRMSMRTESSFSKTNQQLWIPNTLYGNRLDEKELADLGRRMGVALAHIHPDDLDPNQFPVYSQIADQQERRKLIYKQIVETGSYYPDPGGTTFRVTIKKPGEGGERVDLRTKDGKLFQLPIDKLPSYTTMVGNKKKGTNFPIEAVDKDGYPTTGHFWNFTR